MPQDYADLLARAKEIIDSHNESGSKPIDFEAFKAKLQELGGTDAAALKAVTWEDLEALGIPRLRARQIAEIFRKEESGGAARPRLSKDEISEASNHDLVHEYDPRKTTSNVAEELRKRGSNRRFVVFDESGGVHRKATLQLLEELQRGEAERDFFPVAGSPTNVYRVGERPSETVDEHPLRKGARLRRDGKDDLDIPWGSLKLEVRQLLRFAVESGELVVKSNDDAFDLYERVSRDEGDLVKNLSTRYPRAAVWFKEALRLGNLPRLKIEADTTSGARRQDPFHGGAGHKQF